MRAVSFREYVQEILKGVEYKPCEESDCIIAISEALPGCMTQGGNFEEARELIIDAIETWILSAIKDGDSLPEINGCLLALNSPAEAIEDGETVHA